jgi:hypothetical protein
MLVGPGSLVHDLAIAVTAILLGVPDQGQTKVIVVLLYDKALHRGRRRGVRTEAGRGAGVTLSIVARDSFPF